MPIKIMMELPVKIIGHNRNGRKSIRKPVNKDTMDRTFNMAKLAQ
jgi:hypothetical protein